MTSRKKHETTMRTHNQNGEPRKHDLGESCKWNTLQSGSPYHKPRFALRILR